MSAERALRIVLQNLTEKKPEAVDIGRRKLAYDSPQRHIAAEAKTVGELDAAAAVIRLSRACKGIAPDRSTAHFFGLHFYCIHRDYQTHLRLQQHRIQLDLLTLAEYSPVEEELQSHWARENVDEAVECAMQIREICDNARPRLPWESRD